MMIHELQGRLNQDQALRNISILGVDPGTMASGLQRLAPWFIRVVLFKIVYPLILALNPDGDLIRSPESSAADVLDAAVGSISPDGEPPKEMYLYRRQQRETGSEAKDVTSRHVVWTETARYAELKQGDTVLSHWQ